MPTCPTFRGQPLYRLLDFRMAASVALLGLFLVLNQPLCAADVPALPDRNGAIDIPAQEWPLRPGPRTIKVHVTYPGGLRQNVAANTGIFLTLHNWGGSACIGTADPAQLANRCDCVAVCVDYLQSGPVDSIQGPEPYDYGWLQGLDALRALHYVWSSLRELQIPFNDRRLFATGGSGGGNVSLMANKLAPRTFTAVIDMCGMKKLSDDIAFDLPGGSELNARYRREREHPYFLGRDAQEIRFVGHPEHLRTMRALNCSAQIVTVHGVTDHVCPIGDAREMIANMQASKLNVKPILVDDAMLDGSVFTSTGHALGNRTEIVFRTAGEWLIATDPNHLERPGKTDFEIRDARVRYRTSRGVWIVDYTHGYPVGRFEPDLPSPNYSEHLDLTYRLDECRVKQSVNTIEDWNVRRGHVIEQFERAAGEFPGVAAKVPLETELLEERETAGIIQRKIRFRSDHFDRVTAWFLIPKEKAEASRRPAMLCLHQTTNVGKDEPAGIAGDPQLQYALELTQRGFITLIPDYPSFGEHPYDFAAHPEYASGTMKAIWDNTRAIDFLESQTTVDREKIGVIGHSLGGHNAIFTAVFDQRIQVVVSSCGFCTLSRDDIPSWTGPRYMPRIANVFHNSLEEVPFDFTELIAAIAPRPFMACAATQDDDFDVSGVRLTLEKVRPIYQLHHAGDRLVGEYVEAPHSFPRATRNKAYEFIVKHLR